MNTTKDRLESRIEELERRLAQASAMLDDISLTLHRVDYNPGVSPDSDNYPASVIGIAKAKVSALSARLTSRSGF
jgi:hypothetical protein